MSQVFDCPFCGKTSSCGVRLDFDHSIGSILCDSCGAKYEMQITRLSEPIDVYSEWIDMCVPCSLAHIMCSLKLTMAPLCRSEQVNRRDSGLGGDASGGGIGGGTFEEDVYNEDED